LPVDCNVQCSVHKMCSTWVFLLLATLPCHITGLPRFKPVQLKLRLTRPGKNFFEELYDLVASSKNTRHRKSKNLQLPLDRLPFRFLVRTIIKT
jgi:hypothetical protein